MRIMAARGSLAITASAALHAGLLIAIATVVPRPPAYAPRDTAADPVRSIPVIMLPRHISQPKFRGAPSPIRHHRSPLPVADERTPVRPLLALNPEAPSAAPHPDQVRAALRGGAAGCANRNASRLTPAERADCDERLGAGATDAPFIHPGFALDRKKRAMLDAAAAAREARRAELERPMKPKAALPERADYDGDPYVSGAGDSAFGAQVHPPSKRAARQLGRLPP